MHREEEKVLHARVSSAGKEKQFSRQSHNMPQKESDSRNKVYICSLSLLSEKIGHLFFAASEGGENKPARNVKHINGFSVRAPRYFRQQKKRAQITLTFLKR